MKLPQPRRIGACLGTAALLVTPFALACSGAASAIGATDGAIPGNVDAGAFLADAGERDASAVRGPEANAADPNFAAECLDGRDQNGADGLDCSDSSCAQAPSCCVGVTTTGCCRIAGPALDRAFLCAAPPCDDLGGFTTFGTAGPVRASDGAFAPQSDVDGDSGAIAPDVVDPRASIVTLSADLAVPASTDQIDAIAIGLLPGGASRHVVPTAALVVSASRQQTFLLLGETVVGAIPAPTDGAMHAYTLSVDPTGHVVGGDETHTLSADVILPDAPLRAAFFGRATNPGSTPSASPARIGAFHVATAGCDQPAALTRLGSVPIVDETGAALLDTFGDPALASDGTHTYLAFSARSMADPAHRSIFVAVREADGFYVRAPAGGTQPVLVPNAGESLEDPAFVFASGHWTMFATRVHDGTSTLVRTTSVGTDPLAFAPPSDLSVDRLGALSAPAIVPGTPGAPAERLVARLQAPPTQAGVTPAELVLLTLDGASDVATPEAAVCGADVACDPGVRSEQHVYAARATVLAFDSDDVDDPEVILVDDVYRLYYSGRRGSRWGIGMLIAADLGYWRAANQGGPVLTGDGSGFDAVWVRNPLPVVEDGHLSLYYVASDGDRVTFGRAQGGLVPP